MFLIFKDCIRDIIRQSYIYHSDREVTLTKMGKIDQYQTNRYVFASTQATI